MRRRKWKRRRKTRKRKCKMRTGRRRRRMRVGEGGGKAVGGEEEGVGVDAGRGGRRGGRRGEEEDERRTGWLSRGWRLWCLCANSTLALMRSLLQEKSIKVLLPADRRVTALSGPWSKQSSCQLSLCWQLPPSRFSCKRSLVATVSAFWLRGKRNERWWWCLCVAYSPNNRPAYLRDGSALIIARSGSLN